MHPSAARLYKQAKDLHSLGTQTELANALNESPQTVKNWEARGVSNQGALKAQKELGIEANWVLTGEGPSTVALPLSAEVRAQIAQLDKDALRHLDNLVRAHLGMAVINPETPITAPLVRITPNQNVKRIAHSRKG